MKKMVVLRSYVPFLGGFGLFFGRGYGSFREYNQVGEEKRARLRW